MLKIGQDKRNKKKFKCFDKISHKSMHFKVYHYALFLRDFIKCHMKFTDRRKSLSKINKPRYKMQEPLFIPLRIHCVVRLGNFFTKNIYYLLRIVILLLVRKVVDILNLRKIPHCGNVAKSSHPLLINHWIISIKHLFCKIERYYLIYEHEVKKLK